MTKLSTLRKQARESTAWRGHRMKWTKPLLNDTVQAGKCRICGKEVMLLTKPQANDIDIGGEALALSCED
jgi:hypothetical protein